MGVSSADASDLPKARFVLMAGFAVRFGVAYVPVRQLEWRRIYLRL
jgi:hypothetical protein